MGIHIGLMKDWKDHPDWDYLRQGSDTKFAFLVWSEGQGKWFRPKNFTAFREKIKQTNWKDKERYFYLLDLLEADEDYEIHIS